MKKKSESGQAIILIVFAVVGLIGFTALAIDGGMLYADRRHAQSASDAASLAGGGFAALALDNYHIEVDNFVCGTSGLNTIMNDARTTALNRAYSNDYTAAQVQVTANCFDAGTQQDDKYLEFTTEIVKETKTSLIHFAYDGPAVNEVESTVRVHPRGPIALGNAIVALNEAACQGNKYGVILGGSSTTLVHGGGIFSNGCLKCNGNGPNFEVTVDEPYGIFHVGDDMNCDGANLTPAHDDFPEAIPEEYYDIEPPNCSGMENRSMPNGKNVTLDPGVYSKIDDGGKDSIIFNPGLYCVTGSPTAIKISNAYFYGDGVTFYVTDGKVQITGGGSVDFPTTLVAPKQGSNPWPAIEGVLLYMAHGNTSDIKITGNSTSIFEGTIYAPDGDIFATGSGDTAAPIHTQLIGKNVEVSGSAIIDINFDDDSVGENPPRLDLTH